VSGEAFDVPGGDPDGLHAAEQMFRRLADDHASLKASFQQHASIAEDGWTGVFATRFHACAEEISDRFGPVCEAAADAAITLSDYAASLQVARYEIGALNRQAADIEMTHLDPSDRAHAMSQLADQANDITGQLDHAASICASRLAWNEHNLTSLPGTAAAEQLLADVRRATDGLAGKEPPSLWDRTELPRTILEYALAPFDLADGDHWVGLLEKAGEEHERLFENADEAIEEAATACREGGEAAFSALVEAGNALDRAGQRMEIWDAIAPGWVKAGARWASEVRGLSYGLSVAGILADTGTIVSPEDSGEMATVDRFAAVVNAGAIATNTVVEAGLDAGWIAADGAAAMIPGVGEAAIAITGAYLAGDFIYHHRAQLADAAKDIGHALVHADETVARWEVEGVADAESGAVHAAKDAGHAARSMWHSITSTVGSWF